MIDVLLDEGSFSELGRNAGFGTVEGRPVCVYHLKGKFDGCSTEAAEMALKTGCPLIVVLECDGLKISHKAFSDLARLMSKLSLASGVVPRITVVLGKCHSTFCYSHSDFVIATRNCEISLVFPEIIRGFSGKDVNLSGARFASSEAVHFVAESDEEAYSIVRRLLSYLPLNNMEDPPIAETSDEPSRQTEQIEEIIPKDFQKAYDVRGVIEAIVDDGEYMEIQPNFAQNAVVCFGRMDGMTVGIVANNPAVYAGCLDINAVKKITRFVRFCDAFNIPIVNLVDTPGFFPDQDQEISGLSLYATKMLQAYVEATVPVVTVVLRRAYGPAYIAMGSKFAGADVVYAYPNAEFAVTDIDTDIRLMYGDLDEEERKRKLEEYRRWEANADRALERGYVDGVIEPKWTRSRIINALRMLETKRKKLPPRKHDT